MKEISFLNRYKLNETNDYVDISFYEVSENTAPVLKTDEVELTNVGTKKSMMIKVSTKSMIYPINFRNLGLNVFLNGTENNLTFNLYKVDSLEYPTTLPSKISTLRQSNYVDIGAKGFLINLSIDLTIKNSNYYYLLEPNVSDGTTYTTRFNVQRYNFKMPLITVSNEYDGQLPQYIKNDHIEFNDCNIDLNLYNGKFILSKSLVKFKGNRLPINLFYTHTNYKYDSEYVNLTSNVYYQLPNNCKINYFQFIKKHYQQDKYLFINDAGEQLHFSKVKDGYYINDNGRGLFLTINATTYIIEDINGNQLEFNQDGYLVYIRDNIESDLGTYTKGIKITYTKTDNVYHLTSIKDSINREVLITYGTSNIYINYSNNKEIKFDLTDRGVTFITDEYGEVLKFLYNTSNRLVRINKDIEDLVFTSGSTEVSKIVYKINSSAKFTKEYIYTDSNFSNITTITSYNNQKNENNQIIKKYSFDVNGNYNSDYEEINNQKYNENKRIENLLEVQCKINKKNNNQYVSGLEEPISAVSDILISEDEKMNCILNTNEYSNQFVQSFSTNKYSSFRNEGLRYSFSIDYDDIIPNNLTPASIHISIYEEVNDNDKLIHSFKFKVTKTLGLYNVETNETYEFMKLDSSHYLCTCYVPLKWGNITNENINIKFDVKIDYITKIVIENAYVVGDKNTLPTAYFPTSSKKLLPIEDMYYYSEFNQYNNYKNNSKNILCTTMYGLTNPNKIRYVKDSSYELVENIQITLNEIMVNAKNKAKSKKIFWYNDFKNIIVEDNLYSNSSNPEIIFDNNEYLSLTNLAFSIPIFKSENEKNYMMYNFNNVYGKNESTFIETTLKLTENSTMLVNIIKKDVYNRIVEEEKTDRIYSTSDGYYECNYISTIKEYEYDESNNLIKETFYTRNIYDESFDDINYDNYTEIEYTYDSNNNMISKKVNDVEILYEYDNNNNLVKINYPLGTNKFFTYDSKDRLINTFVSNNVKEMKNVVTYDLYNRIEKLFYNGEKSGYKYTYNNNKEIESIYKINNTNEYEKLIENYQLVENNNNEYNLNLLDDQYALIVTDIMNNKIAQIYDKYGKILYLKKYENDAFVLKKQFVYKDGVTLDETKTFETLVDYIIDYDENYRYEYSYNDENELILINKYEIDIQGSTENLVLSKSYEYLNGKLFKEFTDEFILQYNYGRYDLLQQYFIIYNGQRLLYNEYEYSNDGFIKNKKIYHNNNIYTANYTYNDNKLIKYKKPYSQEEEILSYDDESKVTSINSLQNVNYTYNEFGHLIEEINEELGEKYTYEYDQAGNIISKKIYSLNNSLEDEIYYTYGEPNYDILTKINKNGVEFIIQYNENFEPEFIGNDQIEWNNKRPIKYTKGNDEYNYYYNVDGIRYKKALNKTTDEIIEYNLDGDKIISENRKIKVNDEYVDNLTLKYLYEGNNILGFIYKKNNQETLYMYEKDALNTIKAIYKVTNTIEKVAIYKYNAWGEHIVCNPNGTLNNQDDFIGNVNPFRYRGYYYDVETQLFYCKSRYYSPELCRFISPDSIEYLDPESINGLNLYCYCMSNPIMYADPSGHSPEWWQWALAGVGIALVAVAAGMAIIGTGGVAAFGAGALVGSLAVGAGGAIVGGAIGYAVDGVDGILGGALAGFGIGSIVGFAVGGCIGLNTWNSDVSMARQFLTDNGVDSAYHDNIINSFKYRIKTKTINSDMTVYRYYSDSSRRISYWVTPKQYANPVQRLALAYGGNTAQNTATLTLQKGAQILYGKVARVGSYLGGGIQYYVPNLAWLI